jgi:transglutaminase-like putative cysteine protease
MPALIGSVILGLLLPTMSPTFLSSLRPNGSGPIEMVDPQLDLRKNLEQGTNRQVLEYTTNKPTGVYLRLATLPVLSAEGWGQAQVTLRQGAIGAVPGVTAMPAGGARITRVKVDDLRSMYLPAPYAPRAQNATGEWSYDPASLMIIATGTNRARATEGLSYTVESWDIEPDGAALSEAQVGIPDGQSMTRDIPGDVPASVVQLTKQITDGLDQPALKAAAIQAYLRSSQFTYSVQGATGQTSYTAMESFLLKSKTGYCVQFASSMALMARIAGIPTRVAVGFLPGTKSGDTWLVTSHDMHAWPELYFEGQGWVRFEPTPSVASAPSWTVVAPNQPSASTSTVVEPSVSVSGGPTKEQTALDKAPIDDNQGQVQAAAQWRTWLLVAGIALVVLLLLAAPMVIRRLVRRRRLGPADDPYDAVAKAWLEVRDTWLDLGQRWPRGTPRQIADVVGARLPDDVAETSLAGVLSAVERSRYAASFEDVADLRTQVDAVLSGLHSSQPWYRRIEQVVFPPSLTFRLRQWWRRVSSPKAAPALEESVVREASPDDTAYQRPVGAGQR